MRLLDVVTVPWLVPAAAAFASAPGASNGAAFVAASSAIIKSRYCSSQAKSVSRLTMGLSEWRKQDERQLGCLPFPLADSLLLGETRRLHLYEARFLSLFEKSLQNCRCLAAVTVVDGALLGIGAICDVVRWRRREVGVSVTLRCVGRAKLQRITQEDPFISASVVEVTDTPDDKGAEARAALSIEVLELHRHCRELENKLRSSPQLGGDASLQMPGSGGISGEFPMPMQAAVVLGAEEEGGGRVDWGHEPLRVSGFEKPLQEMMRDRKAILIWDTDRATPAGQNRVQVQGTEWLLGSQNQDEEDAQLLSFAAMACFTGGDRAKALLLTDTAMRLSLAAELLRDRLKLLAAKTALRDVLLKEEP